MIYGYLYRALMRLAHRYDWHYAPPSYPDGDTLLWCHWCGLRQVVRRRTIGEKLMQDFAEKVDREMAGGFCEISKRTPKQEEV